MRPATDTVDNTVGVQDLTIEGIVLEYGAVRALRNVSLTVPAGAIVTVLGSNGAGKTSLMRTISGTHRLYRGRVRQGTVTLGRSDITSALPERVVRRGLIQVPEGRRVFARLTVRDNLMAGSIVTPRSSVQHNLDTVLELFPPLVRLLDQRAGLLSGGEQQMLSIGRALMSEPKVLLLDEPSLGLAPKIVDEVFNAIRTINAGGTSILLVEQNASMALKVAHHAVVLESGRVSLRGTSDEVGDSSDLQATYLGTRNPRTVSALPAADEEPTDRSTHGAALTVEGITLAFGGVKAIDDLSLDVQPTSIHAVIGPNGAGKSSLFNVISGVYLPTSGTVGLDDLDLTAHPAHKRVGLGVGRAFQNPTLSLAETVHDNLLLGLHTKITSRHETGIDRAWVDEVAAVFGLSGHMGTPAGTLSYGRQKRVDIARAVISRPRLLLLDEPAAGLDPEESEEMGELVVRLRDRLRMTVLVVEHDMPLVMGIADRITVLNFGNRIADGTPAQISSDPTVIEAYLGSGATSNSNPLGRPAS